VGDWGGGQWGWLSTGAFPLHSMHNHPTAQPEPSTNHTNMMCPFNCFSLGSALSVAPYVTHLASVLIVFRYAVLFAQGPAPAAEGRCAPHRPAAACTS
jgi:hypothetical protein